MMGQNRLIRSGPSISCLKKDGWGRASDHNSFYGKNTHSVDAIKEITFLNINVSLIRNEPGELEKEISNG